MSSSIAWRVALVVFAAAPASPAPEEAPAAPRVRWQVTGEDWARDPRLSPLLAVLDQATAAALVRLDETLGLRPGEAPIRWLAEARAAAAGTEEAPDPGRGRGSPSHFELGRTAFAGGVVEVRIFVARHLARPETARTVAAHEAFHAVLASRLGPRRLEALPRWFREGAAVGFAGESERCLAEAIAGALLAGRPADAFLAGLAGDGAAPHAEGSLAVLWIEKRAGGHGLRELLGRLARGESFAVAFGQLLGGSPEALAPEAFRFARREVRRRLPREAERAFAESLALRAHGKLPAARALWLTLLAQDPEGPLAATLHYFIAKALLGDGGGQNGELDRGRLAGARDHLQALLDSSAGLWRPEALVLLGECLAVEGEPDEAARLWREVLEAFGDDELPARRARAHLDRFATRTPR